MTIKGQSRTLSFVEAVTNVMIGYAVALVTQLAVFPLFGLMVSVTANLMIGAIFTAASLVRSYVLRRIFEHIHVRAKGREVFRRSS